MAVLPQFGGLAEAQMHALVANSGALMSAAAGGNGCYRQYDHCAGVVSGAQSELTCNGGGGSGRVALPIRKRGREGGIEEQYVSSSSALLPVPGMCKEVVQMSQPAVDPGMASTSGRAAAESSSVADALVSELCRQGAEVDALVRTECERLRAGLERARKRQRQELARAVLGAAERRLREKDAELDAARRRKAELEELVRQAAAESQAWCSLARGHEAVAAGLHTTLDRLLLRGVNDDGGEAAADEGFGESADGADDAESCCFVSKDEPADAVAAVTPSKWPCKACGQREASVLLLPCRHLCLCKACEPRLGACPVCLVVKNASIHVAGN